jgi:nitric oxide reductase NorD protein
MPASPLEKLALADPKLSARIVAMQAINPAKWPKARRIKLVDEILWALSKGKLLGDLYAQGLVRLGPDVSCDRLALYCKTIHAAVKNGLTLAQLMAKHFYPVLLYGQKALPEKFQHAVDTMLLKGTYTLGPPLEGLSWLLENHQTKAADLYLDLLLETFSKKISYNLSLKLSYLLPRSVRSFEFSRNHFQIAQLMRVMAVDVGLAERFLAGLTRGLNVLDETALQAFVASGLAKYHQNVVLGRKFLGLNSKTAQERVEDLKTSVSLKRLRSLLERTIQVRVGRFVPIHLLKEVENRIEPQVRSTCYVAGDGKYIYLPEEIACFERKSANETLYKILAKLESAALEFGSYDFDLDRLKAVCEDDLTIKMERRPGLTDFEIFFNGFERPELAEDLFNLFELGRLRYWLKQKYAGLAHSAFTFLGGKIACNSDLCKRHFLHPLYAVVALGMDLTLDRSLYPILRQSEKELVNGAPVEVCASLTLQFYGQVAAGYSALQEERSSGYMVFAPAFGRRIFPRLLKRALEDYDQTALSIKTKLAAQNIDLYAADIRRQLMRQNRIISAQEFIQAVLTTPKNRSVGVGLSSQVDISRLNLEAILNASKQNASHTNLAQGSVRRYHEWDCRVSDYIKDHVRVVDQTLTGCDLNFYNKTLNGRAGLVHRMRKAFELLKPEGLILLRQWIEGDDFDYRALIDFALDKRAGIMPCDRLYIKRIKQQRDVAVLLLVDVSRSTANCIAGTSRSVLSVQKEAIVLFCEALTVVGDQFAVAGFSGVGRLNVDYFRLKNFDESLTETVKQRIGAITPQRSTRMGAAIRHAQNDLMQSGCKVMLLLILSDGFPNDVDYKAEYAVTDTHTAILEARARQIVVKAITVNMGADLRLNELYGRAHHHVIENVWDLPDQLLKMYGKLTRNL